MFEIMDENIKKSNKRNIIQKEMIENLPRIYNALFPPVTSIAIDARIKIMDTRNTLEKWIENNREQVQFQRSIFKNFTDKFQSLFEKIEQIS